MSSTELHQGHVDSHFENYHRFWQNDLTKEAQVDLDNRIDNYTDVVNGAPR
jgi:sterol 24-C-methyltransferase